MKHRITKTFRLIVLTILPLVLLSTNAYCISPEQIYTWVARQMNIEHVDRMPEVTYVDKAELQQIFRDFSSKSYAQMASDHGKDYAEEVMGLYLDNIVGLFHPETKAIFVGEFLDPCRRQAVLAHELMHYLQDKVEGRINNNEYRADEKRMVREMQAGKLERKFEETFCNQDAPVDPKLALLE